MPAHVIYPKVDKRPAGLLEKWLRHSAQPPRYDEYSIFSDDLSMEGARRINGELISFTDAALAALNAGCDMVLLCNQSLGFCLSMWMNCWTEWMLRCVMAMAARRRQQIAPPVCCAVARYRTCDVAGLT